MSRCKFNKSCAPDIDTAYSYKLKEYAAHSNLLSRFWANDKLWALWVYKIHAKTSYVATQIAREQAKSISYKINNFAEEGYRKGMKVFECFYGPGEVKAEGFKLNLDI